MLLGLDIGTKRTGVAVSEGIIASELTTLESTGETLVQEIAGLCADEGADTLVVGLPLSTDGSDTLQAKYVREVVDQLRRVLPDIRIELVDEYLSTAEVYRRSEEMGYRRDQIEPRIDQLAAQIILQQYIYDQEGKVSAEGE